LGFAIITGKSAEVIAEDDLARAPLPGVSTAAKTRAARAK